MRRQHLIVSGIPASGKSTLGRALAQALGVVMWDKDEILEELFNEKGVGDAHWRTALSRDADEILRQRTLQSESAVIVSWWCHPASTSASGTPTEWLSDLKCNLIEVNCVCDPAIAAERFKARTRHSGHLDQFKSYEGLLASFEQQAALGPLSVGRLVQVYTDRDLELQEVLAGINSLSTPDQ